MKITCQVVEDLLPLYHDGVCSEDSRVLVEEHLNTCAKCGNMNRALNEEPEAQTKEDKKTVRVIRKGIRSLILRGVALGIALVLLLTSCGAGLYYVNWWRERETILRFVKENGEDYAHTGAGDQWDGEDEYFHWFHNNYRFVVSIEDPYRGRSVVDVLPFDNLNRYDTREWPYVWISVEYDREDGYYYHVNVEKLSIGLEESFTVNGELELLQENETHQLLIDTYQRWIQNIVQAAQEEWPFLSE